MLITRRETIGDKYRGNSVCSFRTLVRGCEIGCILRVEVSTGGLSRRLEKQDNAILGSVARLQAFGQAHDAQPGAGVGVVTNCPQRRPPSRVV